MAEKQISSLSFCTLLLVLPLLFQPTLANSKDIEPSGFDFLKKLQGCHKGDNVSNIHMLKNYLQKFGYLKNYSNNGTHANDDYFNDLLESALKTYQLNFNLNITGTLDTETVSTMIIPRCGVADIINGTSSMHSGHQNHPFSASRSIDQVAYYSFFPGRPRWPPSQSRLTYTFRPGTRADAITPVVNAFRTWERNTHFRFTRVQGNANMYISFERGNHGDGSPFDGRGGTLAHAFAPTNGRFHYDADEVWSVNVRPGTFHLETVALHEIGHLLGLGHSSVVNAIMYPSIAAGTSKGLDRDDIQGIKVLYNR